MFKKINLAVLALLGSASAFDLGRANIALNVLDDAVLDLDKANGYQTNYKYENKLNSLNQINEEMFQVGYQLNSATPDQLRIVIGKLKTIIQRLEAANEKYGKYKKLYLEVDNTKFNGAMQKVMALYQKIVQDFLGVMQEKIDGKGDALYKAWQSKMADEYSTVKLLQAFRQNAEFYKGGYVERVVQGDWDLDLAPNTRNFVVRLALDQVADLSVGAVVTGYATATSNGDAGSVANSVKTWSNEVRTQTLNAAFNFSDKPIDTVWARVQQLPQMPNRWSHMADIQYNLLKENFPDYDWAVITFKERDQCMDMSYLHNWNSNLYQKVALDGETQMVTLGKAVGSSNFFQGQADHDCVFRQHIMDLGNYCTTNQKTKEVCLKNDITAQFALVRTDWHMNAKVRGGDGHRTRWAWFSNKRVWATQSVSRGGRTFDRKRANDQDVAWLHVRSIPTPLRKTDLFGKHGWYLMMQRQGNTWGVRHSNQDFNSMYWQSGAPRVFARVCDEGSKCTHSTLFYKRLNNKDFDPYGVLLHSWTYRYNNVFNQDFEIYKSYDDMIRGENRFTFCNFDGGVGFPRDCGLTGATSYDWISDKHDNSRVPNWSLYMLDY